MPEQHGYDIEYGGKVYTITSDHALSDAEFEKYAAMVRSGKFGEATPPTPPLPPGKPINSRSELSASPIPKGQKDVSFGQQDQAGFSPMQVNLPAGATPGKPDPNLNKPLPAKKKLGPGQKADTAHGNTVSAFTTALRAVAPGIPDIPGAMVPKVPKVEAKKPNSKAKYFDTGTIFRIMKETAPKDDITAFDPTTGARTSGSVAAQMSKERDEFMAEFGFDPDLYPAKAAQAIAGKITHNIQTLLRPFTSMSDAVISRLPPALLIRKAVSAIHGEEAAKQLDEPINGLLAGTIALPIDASLDVGVLLDKNSSARDRGGAAINIALKAFPGEVLKAGGAAIRWAKPKVSVEVPEVAPAPTEPLPKFNEPRTTSKFSTSGKPGEPVVNEPPAIWRNNDIDTPITLLEDPEALSKGYQKVKLSDGTVSYVPAHEVIIPENAAGPTKTAPPIKGVVEPPVEPDVTPPPVIADVPEATGLANQVQEREALKGIIDDIEKTSGKSAEVHMEEGKAAFEALGDTHADRMAEAEAMAKRIASGEEPISGTKIGVLLEAKRHLLAEIAALERRYAAGGTFLELKAAREAIRAANERLIGFLNDVQQGKGIWSDVGRALQAGSTINEGVFAEVIHMMERKGKRVSDAMRKHLEDITAKVAERDARIADLEREAEAAKSNPAEPRQRRYNRVTIQKKIDDLVKQWNEPAKGEQGPGGKASGAIRIGPEDIKNLGERAKLAKEIIKAHIDLHVGAPLEDVILAIQKTFREKLNIDIDRQAVIDMASAKGETRTRSELAKQKQDLMNQMRRESTTVKDALTAKQAAAKAAKAAKAQFERLRQASAKADRLVEEIQDQTAKAKAREQAKWDKANMDAAWKAYLEKEKIAKRAEKQAERIQESIDKAKAEIEDLKEQLAQGRFRKPSPRERQINQELANVRAERQAYAKEVQAAMKKHDTSTFARVAKFTGGAVRGLKLGSDVGVTMRQALFGLGNPVEYGTAIKAATKTVFSKKNFALWETASKEKKIGGVYMEPVRQEARLSRSMAGVDPEELGIGSLFKNIPVVGGALERWQHTLINTLRNEVFDASYISGMNKAELAQRANFINDTTGRGNIGNIPEALQLIMTSPKYEASRWGTIGQLVKNPLTIIKNGKINRAAVANIKTMARTAGSVYAIARIAELKGYRVDWNHDSSDFMKMRRYEGGKVEWDATGPHYVGGTPTDEVWDLSAGIAPRIRDILRVAMSWQHPDMVHNWVQIAGKTVGRTVSPGVSVPAEQTSYAYQRSQGVEEKDLKSPLSGWVPEEEQKGWMAFAPLIYTAFSQAGKGDAEPGDDFNEKSAMWAWFREFVGTGVNRYPAKANRDGLGLEVTDKTRNDPVSRELKRLDYTHELSANYGETDKELEARRQAFAEYAYPTVKQEIEDPAYKKLTKKEKQDHVAKVIEALMREYSGVSPDGSVGPGAEAAEKAKERKAADDAATIEKQKKQGIK